MVVAVAKCLEASPPLDGCGLPRGRVQDGGLFRWLQELYPVWAGLDEEWTRTAAAVGLAEMALSVPVLVLLVFIQVIYVCMVYGPIAAYLVEAFPARIRYTSLSLPYHIGNGVFGGLVPLIGLSSCAATGSIYAGLYYPMIVASITFVVGSLVLKETHGTKIWDEVGGAKS